MTKVIVQHHVANYDTWYPLFIEHGEVRRKHGATGHIINRPLEDPNSLVVVNNSATAAGARAFMEDPSLADVMHRAGVDSQPVIWLVDEAENTSY